jgi:hypothetical protein
LYPSLLNFKQLLLSAMQGLDRLIRLSGSLKLPKLIIVP